eukprot:SAG11_NODE_3010_length_2766_cov_13.698163_2_plen_172_part_00
MPFRGSLPAFDVDPLRPPSCLDSRVSSSCRRRAVDPSGSIRKLLNGSSLPVRLHSATNLYVSRGGQPGRSHSRTLLERKPGTHRASRIGMPNFVALRTRCVWRFTARGVATRYPTRLCTTGWEVMQVGQAHVSISNSWLLARNAKCTSAQRRRPPSTRSFCTSRCASDALP